MKFNLIFFISLIILVIVIKASKIKTNTNTNTNSQSRLLLNLFNKFQSKMYLDSKLHYVSLKYYYFTILIIPTLFTLISLNRTNIS